MNNTPEPQNREAGRLQALREHAIIDTLPEPVFDEIARRAAAVCETPIAMVTLVDDRRQWFKARVGFALPELPRGIGFDAAAVEQTDPLVIPDASADPQFSSDPLVLSELHIRFYAGAQITTEEGFVIGTVAVMDHAARKLSPSQVRALREQAQQAALQLNLRRKLVASTMTAGAEAPTAKIVPSKAGTEAGPRAILPDVMMRFGRDLRYSYVSPFAVETIGLRPDTLLGREVGAERTPVGFAAPLKSALQRAVENRRIEEIEFLYMSPSGERLFQTRLMPEISGGEVSAILSITREVSPEERPLPAAPPKPELRALLGMAIAESGSIPELLQNCAYALAEYSGAPLVRIWLRDANKSELLLRASAGDAAYLISGDPGSTVVELPADADTLDALAERAFASEAAEAEARELKVTSAYPLKSGSVLLGLVAVRDREAPDQEVRDEILESSGSIASAVRRGQEADSLAEQTTVLAKDLLDAKLALQKETDAAAGLNSELQQKQEAAERLAEELEREAEARANLARELERETVTSAELSSELAKQAEAAERIARELEREAEARAQLVGDLEREAETRASLAKELERTAESSASLAHELRTPLNSVLGLTNLLLGTQLEPAQRELGEMTRASARALLQLVNETFDGPRGEEGEADIEPLPFNLREVIEDVGAMLAARAQGKGIDLVVRCSPALPESMLGDAGAVRQILTNLVDNAIKFTREGFVLLDAGSEEQADGAHLIALEVEDTGIGVPPEKLDSIFDRYVQAAETSEGGESGSGLGLAISRELTEKMGGTIAVRSQVDDGSIFRVTLRLPVDPNAPEPPDGSHLRGLRVLVVDGPQLQQYALREQISEWGVDVELVPTVGDMLDAMQDALQDEDPFHVILMDERMEGSDPRGVIWAVLNTPAFEHARLVILTSVGRHRDIERMVAEGLADALTKPLRRRPLMDALSLIASDVQERAERSGEDDLSTDDETPVNGLHLSESDEEESSAKSEAAAEASVPAASEVAAEEAQESSSVPTDEAESDPAAAEASAALELEAPVTEAPSETESVEPEPLHAAESEAAEPIELEAPTAEASEEAAQPAESPAEPHETAIAAAETHVIANSEEIAAKAGQPDTDQSAQAKSTLDHAEQAEEDQPSGQPAVTEAVSDAPAAADQTTDPVDDDAAEHQAEPESAEVTARADDGDDEDGGQEALEPEDSRDTWHALVIEDDTVNQRVARMMLEKMGGVVDVASSGNEAVDLFETRVYDLVLIDCRMTGMDGYETTEILRRMEAGERHTPIIAVTADTSEGVKARCLEAGMDAYIAKPVHEEDLKYEIEKLLNSNLPAREIPEPAPYDEILDRRALVARVAGNTEVLRSLANLCQAECARLMEEIQDAISSGDRSEFLRATHKLRGNIMSMEARAAVEAVRRLELTANQGRPADAEAMLDPLQYELNRLVAAMNAILDDSEPAVSR